MITEQVIWGSPVRVWWGKEESAPFPQISFSQSPSSLSCFPGGLAIGRRGGKRLFYLRLSQSGIGGGGDPKKL